MNGHTWEVSLDQLRAEHRAEILQTESGTTYLWTCSCGDRGSWEGSYGKALAERARHLRTAHRRIIAQFGRV